MKEGDLLDHLTDLARKLNFEVRTDRGSFRDGICRLTEKNVIVLNRTSAMSRKIEVLSRALSDQPLDGVFLLPAVREVIEEAKGKEQRPQLGR
ncbi:MAG: hypothetical protein NTW14_10010 [bacterium]|nr:hypothetical protein [bacterium]